MQNTLKAGFAYFMLVFAVGFLFGVIRTLFIAPWAGPLAAVLIELPFILVISWLACSWVLHKFSVPNVDMHRLAMGAFAFALLMIAEVLVSVFVDGRNLGEHLALYKTLPAIIGLVGQIMFALFPFAQEKLRSTSKK